MKLPNTPFLPHLNMSCRLLLLAIAATAATSCATTAETAPPGALAPSTPIDASSLPNMAVETPSGFSGSALAYQTDSAAAVRVSRELAFRLAIALADDVLEAERELLAESDPSAGASTFILALRLAVAGMSPSTGVDADCASIAHAVGGWYAECKVVIPKPALAEALRRAKAPDLWAVLGRSDRLSGWVTSP